MIAPALAAEIVRLWHAEQWKVGTIAAATGVHHSVVTRVLVDSGEVPGRASLRRSIVDPYLPVIRETLEKYPRLTASRLYEMARARGYRGSQSHFRHVVARHRPHPVAEAYLRLRTLPGEQAQVDWGHFGTLPVGRAARALMGFVMVLSYSRQIFLRFSLGADMPRFVGGHLGAFDAFAGVPRVLLYDNLRSAVLERVGPAIHFHPMLLELAAHYHFEPRPVAVARGNEKGRVERAIRYIRDSFFAARPFRDLADLNAQAAQWCAGIAAERLCPEDRRRRVEEVFAAEQPFLLPLPANPFPSEERLDVHVGRTPYVRFDLNDYSVPADHVGRTLVVHATDATVRVVDGAAVIARHVRSWDKGAQVEDEAHVRALVARKRAARHHRGLDHLHHTVPTAAPFFAAVAERAGSLGRTMTGLLRLLDLYGPGPLDQALALALAHGAPHLAAVEQLLDQHRHASHQPPPIAMALPDDPRVRDMVARPHALATYDLLTEDRANDDDTDTPDDPKPR